MHCICTILPVQVLYLTTSRPLNQKQETILRNFGSLQIRHHSQQHCFFKMPLYTEDGSNPSTPSSSSSSSLSTSSSSSSFTALLPLISIIMPNYNNALYLPEALESILAQTYAGPLELSFYDDGSSDDSVRVVESFRDRMRRRNIRLTVTLSNSSSSRSSSSSISNSSSSSSSGSSSTWNVEAQKKKTKELGQEGCGWSKNKAMQAASPEAKFWCLLDSDDVMHPQRIEKQYTYWMNVVHRDIYDQAEKERLHIIGCKIKRIPEGSTPRYEQWVNSQTNETLLTQAYQEVPIPVVTWFSRPHTFHRLGYFETSAAEDMKFWYTFLQHGGRPHIHPDPTPLLNYRYHCTQLSHLMTKELLFQIRLEAFQEQVLKGTRFAAQGFWIWGGGNARRLFRSLPPEWKSLCKGFADVDEKKIRAKWYVDKSGGVTVKKQIVHWTQVKPPAIICVRRDAPDQNFETYLASLNWKEGQDYYFF